MGAASGARQLDSKSKQASSVSDAQGKKHRAASSKDLQFRTSTEFYISTQRTNSILHETVLKRYSIPRVYLQLSPCPTVLVPPPVASLSTCVPTTCPAAFINIALTTCRPGNGAYTYSNSRSAWLLPVKVLLYHSTSCPGGSTRPSSPHTHAHHC